VTTTRGWAATCSDATTASPSPGCPTTSCWARRRAAALTSARGLEVGQGAGPTARKIRATGREGTRSLLRDAQPVMAVLDLELADHEGNREAIRTIQLALVGGHALGGAYGSPYRTAERRILLHPIRLCLAGQARI